MGGQDAVEYRGQVERSALVLTTGRKVKPYGGNGTISESKVVGVARVYRSGELSVSKAMVNGASKPPRAQYGPRMVRGLGPVSARALRRAVVYRSQAREGAQFVMLTLTSQEIRTDDEMRAALGRLLSWGRKYLGPWFGWYVWVAELQARGVLHFHVLLAQRVPKPLFLRLRRLWADTYGMGAGSVDIRRMRSGKGAAKYMAKYVVKSVHGEPRYSRHTGELYVRDHFRGNPAGMSQEARWGTRPAFLVWAPWGTFAGLDSWHGGSRFYDSQEEAETALAALLAVPSG